MEIWKDIRGYEDYYQVSKSGKVKSLTRKIITCENEPRTIYGRNIKINDLPNGYQGVSLSKNNVRETKLLHRILAEAFIDNPDELPVVNHKNHIRNCNELSNLEWCTQSENILYSSNHGRHRGESIGNSKIKENDILDIFNYYANGISQEKIGFMYDVKDNTIGLILKRKTWSHSVVDQLLIEKTKTMRINNYKKYFHKESAI